MVLLVMWPEGKEASPRFLSDSSDQRTSGFLKIDINSGRPFSSFTIRTDSRCFGRLRLIADFNELVIGPVIRNAINKQKMHARARKQPKIRAAKIIITRSGWLTAGERHRDSVTSHPSRPADPLLVYRS